MDPGGGAIGLRIGTRLADGADQMASTRLELLRELAGRIAQALDPLPGLSCVFTFGSVASGHIDDRSDVDLAVVLLDQLPPKEIRASLLDPLAPNWHYGTKPSNPMWRSIDRNRRVAGVPVEVHYQSARVIDVVLNQVVRGAITTSEIPFRPYTFAGMIRRSFALADPSGDLARWRRLTSEYPPRLKRSVVDHFLPILLETHGDIVDCARRGAGPSTFIHLLNLSADAMRSILYAVNDLYDPADKWADVATLPHLRTVPRDFVERYSSVLSGPFDGEDGLRRAQDWARLAAEVADIAIAGRSTGG